MADVVAAIAAAMSAATADAPPISPIIKSEPWMGEAMVVDSELPPPTQSPQRSPQSPLKRSRSPDEPNERKDTDGPEEKRMKMELGANEDFDEIARMVQAAQASVMKEFHSAPELETATAPKPYMEQPDQVFETTEQEQNTTESALEAALDQQHSPPKDAEAGPDTLWSNPRDYTRRKHIVPALGALAVDILIALSEQTLEDTVATLASDTESDISKEYGVLRGAFDLQHRQLSNCQDAPRLLDANKLGIKGQMREVIRIANLASTCASIFGTNEITLEEVNNNFLHIFVPEGRELTHDVAELYLGLKTQLFLAVLESDTEKTRDQLLEELFVTGVEYSLEAHHPAFPLTVSELGFIANSKGRKAMLSIASAPTDSIYSLSKQFTYEAFLDSLSTYLNDNIESIQAEVLGKTEAKVIVDSPAPADNGTHDLADGFDLNAVIAEASRAAAQSALQPTGDEANGLDDLSAFLTENVSRAVEQSRQAASSSELPTSIASAAESASKATALALESIARNQYHPTALPHSSNHTPPTANHNGYQPQQTQTHQQYFPYQQQQQQQPAVNVQIPYQTPSNHLPPNQSDSTPALYERARQAAAARSSSHARREGSHSTRRPWSPEEEKALMMGLDMVKGPHWSQILSLFGPNGSISQILADRTQVQLKDKARNLKLFFLKTNSEMPYYLQCVTGELKTRAPTQAARKEAEEKARMNSEEHQAHINGILTLAGGLQNNTAPRSSPAGPVLSSTTPSQPLSHTHSRQNAPTISQQPSQPIAPAQPPRPVIPAPQPVSLPTLTPTNQHHAQPSLAQQSVSRPEIALVSKTALKQEELEGQQEEPVIDLETESLPNNGGLSSEDAALLGLKAAMEGESAAAAASAVPFIKQEENVGELGTPTI
ncbi:hypothetical protein F5Y19DRAFT_483583 [Xylariaceae sp. FL1651]|nr:hypothetical protein F5Y19DRAFT_483583 [Xylariaceae sp. FL1651]